MKMQTMTYMTMTECLLSYSYRITEASLHRKAWMERPSKKGQRIQPKYAVWAVCAVLAYFVRFDWKGFVLGRFPLLPFTL